MQLSAADKAAVDKVRAARSAVVMFDRVRPSADPGSGQRDETDAIAASWLPGSEAGVADDRWRWPHRASCPVLARTLVQEPINVGDPHYNPLYPYGYGLRTHVGHATDSARH
jgi:beta-glucosidase